jgi:hypothetical protein
MSVEWLLIRGSGLVAYGLLAASMAWGLFLSMRARPRAVKSLTVVHEGLSVGALLATTLHMAALWTHDYLEFTVAELLVPGVSDWRPISVAWGVMAFYGMVIVTASFYLRSRITQRYWRLLHFGAFGVFLAGLLHGLLSGTDTSHPVVLAMYISTVSVVIILLGMRVARELGVDRPTTERTSA